MKKRKVIVIIICVLALCIAGATLLIGGGKKPYRNLDASQIVSATALLEPPDKTVQITNIEKLVEYLQDVVVYREDNSYAEYSGQAVTFTLTMSDGSQTKITIAHNQFLVIDGVGYQAKYEPCEALSQYANSLLSK